MYGNCLAHFEKVSFKLETAGDTFGNLGKKLGYCLIQCLVTLSITDFK